MYPIDSKCSLSKVIVSVYKGKIERSEFRKQKCNLSINICNTVKPGNTNKDLVYFII